jgi:hypothetical protein
MVGVGGQEVYLSVATALSEIWVIQDYGCPGGVFPVVLSPAKAC